MLRRDGEVFRLGTAMAENSFKDPNGPKQGAWVAGKPGRIQAKSQAGTSIKVRISIL
jgi:hypothetical protein